MTNLVRWDPFTDLRQTMDRLFDEGFSRPWRFLPAEQEGGTFPIEVAETEDAIEVRASLPGVRPEDVEITVANDVLTMKAEHREQTEDKKKDYYRREIRYGAYHRSISLPAGVDADRAEARFQDGMLHLKLPKAEALRPKQIKVSGGNGSIAAGEASS
jgi:HSP20 family protein